MTRRRGLPNDDLSLRYRSFVLRLWLEAGSGEWRVSLEDPHSAERLGFKNIDELFTYLLQWTTDRPSTEADARSDQ